jgi:hypothetical protein
VKDTHHHKVKIPAVRGESEGCVGMRLRQLVFRFSVIRDRGGAPVVPQGLIHESNLSLGQSFMGAQKCSRVSCQIPSTTALSLSEGKLPCPL